MPRGPKGEKCPADLGHGAHRLFHFALGEEEDKIPSGLRLSGAAGAKAYAESLTKEEGQAIAKKAAATRWGKQA